MTKIEGLRRRLETAIRVEASIVEESDRICEAGGTRDQVLEVESRLDWAIRRRCLIETEIEAIERGGGRS